MHSRIAVLASCLVVAACVLLTVSAPVAAAPKPIRGKLSKPGYTVMALAASGKARAVTVRRGRFKVRPPARRVTLHLRARSGKYAGPIVLRRERRGRLAILGVKAGARLGGIRVRRSHARVRRKPRERWIDTRHRARARKGTPIGAGRFGRVRSRARGRAGPGRDLDFDGIPDALDIDDDGDLVLDNLDRSIGARGSQFAPSFGLFTGFWSVTLADTVNANAAAVTTQQIDAFLSELGLISIGVSQADAELDCGGSHQDPPREQGLVYCSAGGTGRAPGDEPFPGAPFPGEPGGAFDPDGDGFGTMQPGPGGSMLLAHGATTDQIGTGDNLIERVTTGGVETLSLATVQYVFVTVPALVAYDDGAGNSATVSYPVHGHTDPSSCPPDCAGPDPGVRGNGFPVAPRPPGDPAAGDVVVTLTFWRPQRARMAGDPAPAKGDSGEWIDIGGLVHTLLVADIGVGCPQSSLSGPSPTLAPPTFTIWRPNAGGFVDLADDQPANAANKLTYTVNLSRCLAANGLPPWEPGEERGFNIEVISPGEVGDLAAQGVFFKRE